MAGIRRWLPALLALGLLLGFQAQAGATFPGTNGKIMFSSQHGSRWEIETVNPNGAGRTTISKGRRDADGAWSPEGTQIAFVHESARRDELKIMNADGSHRRTVITTAAHHGLDEFDVPAWSPSGNELAVCAYGYHQGAGYRRIFTVGTDGSGLTNISGWHTDDCDPDWSPDGSLIAFNVYDWTGRPAKVLTMSPTGANRTVILNGNRPSYPSFSPDSSTILFDALRHNRFPYALGAVPTAGGSITWLTPDTRKHTYESGSWSPDGSKIVYYRTSFAEDRPGDLWIANADGSDPQQLTHSSKIDEWEPNWQAT